MNYINVNLTIKCYWQFKEFPEYKISRCKKVINSKKGKILKYHNRGFFINGKYIKRNEINKLVEPIKITTCPF